MGSYMPIAHIIFIYLMSDNLKMFAIKSMSLKIDFQ